jgi:hypothetical protein
MSSVNGESIKQYFDELVKHHNGIFGIFSAAKIEKVNYIAKAEKIFGLIDILKKVDSEFDNSFLELILQDILKFLKQQSLATNNTDKTVLGYNTFCEINNLQSSKQEGYTEFIEYLKKYKPLLENLLNTKLFYLDKYICHKVSESNKAQYFLGIKNLTKMTSVLEYANQDTATSYMKLDYAFFEDDGSCVWDEDQIKFIKSLLDVPQEEENQSVEQLIKFKSKIPFFDGLDDKDIRYLIADAKFRQYKKDEPVIVERDSSLDIFFLLKGECRIMVKGNEVGRIPGLSIFGEFAFITNEKRSATIKPTQPSIIISFNFDLNSFETNPCLYSKFYKNISSILVKKLLNQNS